MGQFQEHAQVGCRRCQKATLHIRDQETMPSVVYALLSIFTCGFFLIVWLTHAIVLSYANNAKPWLCSVCGEPAR
jgi:hypothetical protein